ncbi:unnamed protein product [Polarella glacialis]|uniref:Uncharacterized protein n=1 Tax=Polarella glacialis TaxID=89957 RepID=A0A813IWT7_POLGL|nr:unnamed protein product [Polarella glacialis]
MLTCLSGFLAGAGIGAYNARELLPCLDGTLQVTCQKAKSQGCDCGPPVQKAKEAAENAKQAVEKALGRGPKPSPAAACFRTFQPPPEGCVGWGLDTLPHHAIHFTQLVAGSAAAVAVAKILTEAVCVEDAVGSADLQLGTAVLAAQRTQPDLFAERLALLKEELAPSHLGPLKDSSHLQAAVEGNVKVLSEHDPQLREALEADKAALGKDAKADAAFRLYTQTLLAFDPGPEIRPVEPFQLQHLVSALNSTLQHLGDWRSEQWLVMMRRSFDGFWSLKP